MKKLFIPAQLTYFSFSTSGWKTNAIHFEKSNANDVDIAEDHVGEESIDDHDEVQSIVALSLFLHAAEGNYPPAPES